MYSECPITGNPNLNANGNMDTLFVDKPDCQLPKNAVVLNTINTPDGLPAFKIITLVKGDERMLYVVHFLKTFQKPLRNEVSFSI